MFKEVIYLLNVQTFKYVCMYIELNIWLVAYYVHAALKDIYNLSVNALLVFIGVIWMTISEFGIQNTT